MRALRNNARPPTQAPLQRHLRGRAIPLPRNLSHNLILQQQRRRLVLLSAVRIVVIREGRRICGVGVRERRVGGHVDGVGGVVEEPVCLREVGVEFHLVDGGRVGGRGEEGG